MTKVSLYGTGGHAEVVQDALRATGIGVHVAYDDLTQLHWFAGRAVRPGLRLTCHGELDTGDVPLVVCIGQNAARAEIVSGLRGPFATVVHPSALVAHDCVVGEGTVVLHRAILQLGVHLGAHVIINSGAVVGVDAGIDDYVHVSPQATIGDGAYIAEGVHVGAGAVIGRHAKIGAWSTIGAGAVVDGEVLAHCTVVGNPGRIVPERHGQRWPSESLTIG